MRKHFIAFGGFAYGRSETNPDSEQIEHTVAKPQMRNSVSAEQIQEESHPGYLTGHSVCYVPSNFILR